MQRLSSNILDKLEPQVRLPEYDRAELQAGIVHLGLGAFHRAHQCVYTDDAVAHSGGGWGIIGVSMRSDTVSQQLTPQNCLYSLMSEDANESALRVIGVIKKVLVAHSDLAEVVAAIADPQIHLVTLTITEKGYNIAADGISLDSDDPVIRADLEHPDKPASAIGLLALGLSERYSQGGASLTVLSCDNLSENGKRLKGLVLDYARSSFPQMLEWLASAVSFPCSMVDRIVPAMTEAQREQQSKQLGVFDQAAVNTEPFSQWIVEDNFASSRPAWEKVGVQLVADVAPYEEVKLRLLNASHSAIAYCGLLAGAETVDQLMRDEALGQFIARLMNEDLIPALDGPADFDLSDYRDRLLERFHNPRLEHRCAQIAMDGTEKIRQRWIPTLQSNTPSVHLMKALSSWCYFVLCTELPISDPRAERLLQERRSDEALQSRLHTVLSLAGISSGPGIDVADIVHQLENHFQIIKTDGVRGLISA